MQKSNTSIVPERFRKAILLHLYKNLGNVKNTPLILNVSGPPGEGKTYQINHILKEIGAEVKYVTSGDLEDEHSGIPAKRVRRAYFETSNILSSNTNTVVALVLNDIDAGIGNWGELVQYTVNTQTVVGELMTLADFPDFMDGKQIRRVPIIMTCNDSNKLYKPLIRAGRMTHFQWKPSIDEKVPIVNSYFDFLSNQETIDLIVSLEDEYKKKTEKQSQDSLVPISFYAQLKSHLEDSFYTQKIDMYGFGKALQKIRQKNSEPSIGTDFNSVVFMAKKVMESYVQINYLEG